MLVPQLVVGLVMLLFGRSLFWLFAAALGFVVATGWAVGVMTGGQVLLDRVEWQAVAVGVLAGLAGAVAAVFLERLAIAVAGFVAGAEIASWLFFTVAFESTPFYWIWVLLGAIVGAILLWFVFDWALIALSSLLGAALVTDTLGATGVDLRLAFGVLLLLGFV
ncbi:MAG TPA: DUF4203 domain-containing protein, partial [Terriglobales bacterium]|nr:DUF4203 domain-containing protein [Terriglobales bacterium]